jgi:hypothetical protein
VRAIGGAEDGRLKDGSGGTGVPEDERGVERGGKELTAERWREETGCAAESMRGEHTHRVSRWHLRSAETKKASFDRQQESLDTSQEGIGRAEIEEARCFLWFVFPSKLLRLLHLIGR